MLKVIEAQKMVVGDEFEIGNNLVRVVNIKPDKNNRLFFVLETVMPSSKVSSFMTLVMYKRVLITVLANHKELPNVDVL